MFIIPNFEKSEDMLNIALDLNRTELEKSTLNISIDGFIWEVVGIKNGVEVYNNKGTFKGVTSSSTVTIVKDYPLSYEDTTFTVYFWINGDMVDNSVLNSEFVGQNILAQMVTIHDLILLVCLSLVQVILLDTVTWRY